MSRQHFMYKKSITNKQFLGINIKFTFCQQKIIRISIQKHIINTYST